MTIIICLLFVINAIAHVLSFWQLKHSDDDTLQSNAIGVLIFAVINLVLAILIGLGIKLALLFAFVIPLIGGLGLFATTILPKKGRAIDFVILVLDIITLLALAFVAL